MILWLRKDIKEELETISKASSDDDVPFVMGEHNNEGADKKSLREAKNGLREKNKAPIAVREETKVEYNKIINEVQSGIKPELKIPILPREDIPETHLDISDEETLANLDTDEDEFIPIDYETYKNERDYNQERLVYFRGDRVMCTENGTPISNPAIMVGSNWEQYIGASIENSAYIRSPKQNTDYEIYVEDGLYEDEYGPLD